MMEKRNTPAGETCREWKYILIDVLYALSLVVMGVAIGIALCKFWPAFWYFVNWGISV